MAGENNSNGAPPSLRDIAEQAYDDLETGAGEAEALPPVEGEVTEEPLASEERPRDKSGRWVSKSETPPGEAIEPLDPAPRRVQDQTPPKADPAAAPPAARSNQVPEHWSAEDKATFSRLPKEGQDFLLKRHG